MSDLYSSDLQKRYDAEVKELAEIVVEEAEKYDRPIEEVLWETVDGHQWVIYELPARGIWTYTNQNTGDVLNEIDTIYGTGKVKDLNASQIAFAALIRDVRDEINK